MRITEILEAVDVEDDEIDYDYVDPDEDNETFSNHPELHQAFNVIWDWTRGGSGEGGLTPAYNTFKKYRPEYFYTGDMYRVIGLNPKMLQVPDARLLTAKLHKWALSNPRQVMSWSADAEAAVDYGERFEFGVILHQQSSGLDLVEIGASIYENEKEVLAPYANNVSVYGYLTDGEFFPADQFSEFIKYYKTQR